RLERPDYVEIRKAGPSGGDLSRCDLGPHFFSWIPEFHICIPTRRVRVPGEEFDSHGYTIFQTAPARLPRPIPGLRFQAAGQQRHPLPTACVSAPTNSRPTCF